MLNVNHHNYKGDKAKISVGWARAERLFKCPEGLERHHIDGNPMNNSPDNVVFVTRKRHMVLDGRMFVSTHPSFQVRMKIREARLGNKNPMYGKHTRAFTGKKHSEETKRKLSEKMKLIRSEHPELWKNMGMENVSTMPRKRHDRNKPSPTKITDQITR